MEKKRTLLLLSDPFNPHTIKWARGLSKHGFSIFIFSLAEYTGDYYEDSSNINVYSHNIDSSTIIKANGNYSKIVYLKSLALVKKIIREIKPQIVHAHYATSYGLLGALAGFHPYILSVWGDDVFEFPNVSALHRMIFRFNLARADKILSTSNVMAREIQKYTNKPVTVTPFGVDLNKFSVNTFKEIYDPFIIGTVKSMEEKYGIKYLISAFKIVKDKFPDLNLKLLIVGGGSQESMLKQQCKDLEIDKYTEFTGRIEYNKIHEYHQKMTISVFPSISHGESFGVAVIEASACSKPVIVANVGGLPEVVENGVSGIVVNPRDPEAIAKAIEKFIEDKNLIKTMGRAGRKRVEKLYDFEKNLIQMVEIYKMYC